MDKEVKEEAKECLQDLHKITTALHSIKITVINMIIHIILVEIGIHITKAMMIDMVIQVLIIMKMKWCNKEDVHKEVVEEEVVHLIKMVVICLKWDREVEEWEECHQEIWTKEWMKDQWEEDLNQILEIS